MTEEFVYRTGAVGGNIFEKENTPALRVLLNECIHAMHDKAGEDWIITKCSILGGYTKQNNDSFLRIEVKIEK